MPVFISHSFKDEAIYTTLCLALDSANVVRWDPSRMSAGDSLSDQLRSAITKCEVCVCIATRRSIESPWCLAELGAFWGAGKRVLLFLVDPDLTDAMLPPQFKGNLKVSDANELIGAIKDTVAQQSLQSDPTLNFYASGSDSHIDWQDLLESSKDIFYIMGVSLHSWIRMPDFSAIVCRKAKEENVDIRIMTLHPANAWITELDTAGGKHQSTMMVKSQIEVTSKDFVELSRSSASIQYRQLRSKTPNFALTLSGKSAVLVQYLHSLNWGTGPVLVSNRNSEYYAILRREFDELWSLAEEPTELAKCET